MCLCGAVKVNIRGQENKNQVMFVAIIYYFVKRKERSEFVLNI